MKKQLTIAFLFVFIIGSIAIIGNAEVIRHWHFDKADSNNAANGDAPGGTYTFTVDRFGDDNAAALIEEDGMADLGNGEALSFVNESGDRPFTIEWWQKMRTEQGDYDMHADHPVSLLSKSDEYFIGWSNAFRARLSQDRRNYIGKVANAKIDTGKWTHMAVSYDGAGKADGIEIYQNGELLPSRPENMGVYEGMRKSRQPLTLCRSGAGVFDDIVIHDDVLPHETIKRNYQSGILSQSPAAKGNRHKNKFNSEPTEKTLVIPLTDETLEIDGDFEETCWKNAKWHHLSNFNTRDVPDVDTSFALTHDNEFLYAAIQAEEPFTEKIAAEQTRRDGHVFKDDDIELFIDTGAHQNPQHYHWAFNTNDALFDEIATRGAAFCDAKWNSTATSATKIASGQWRMEIRIPLAELTFNPNSPNYWGVNVARSRKTLPKRKLYSFSPVKSFHDSNHFTSTRVADMDPALSWFDIRFIDAEVFPEKGNIQAVLNFALFNESTKTQAIDFTVSLTGTSDDLNETAFISLPPGKTEKRMNMSLPDAGLRSLTMTLTRSPGSKPLRVKRKVVDLTYHPLQVEVLQPYYRNAIFKGQDIQSIRLQIRIAISEKELANYKTVFTLSDKRGKTLIEHSRNAETANETLSAPLPKLEVGEYDMKLELIHRETNQSLQTWNAPLRVLPFSKGQVYLGPSGTCFVKDKPFFPFGVFPDFRIKGLWEAVQMNCNTIEHWGKTLQPDDAWIKAVNEAGLMAFVYPFPKGVQAPKNSRKYKSLAPPPEAMEKLTNHMERIKDLPGVLCWYTANEPLDDAPTMDRVKAYDAIIREVDPYHPTVIVLSRSHVTPLYEDDTAVMGVDAYPRFLANGDCRRPTYVYEKVKATLEKTKANQPVWALLQAYDTLMFGDENEKGANPSFNGLRTQMHQAVIAGAKGIFWYERGYGDIYPEIHFGLQYLGREVNVLKDVLLAANVSGKITLLTEFIAPRRPPEFCFRQAGGNQYVFVSNLSNSPLDFTFKLNAPEISNLFVVGEGRDIPVQEGKFSDSLGSYESRVYTTNKEISQKLSIPETLEKIAHSRKIDYAEGNVFANRKAEITTSWKPRMRKICLTGLPENMIDGVAFTSCVSSGKNPAVVTITFDAPTTLAKLTLDSNIASAVVEASIDGQWRKLADFKANDPSSRRERTPATFSPIETRQLKIRINDRKKVFGLPDPNTQIWEIEAYGPAS